MQIYMVTNYIVICDLKFEKIAALVTKNEYV